MTHFLSHELPPVSDSLPAVRIPRIWIALQHDSLPVLTRSLPLSRPPLPTESDRVSAVVD